MRNQAGVQGRLKPAKVACRPLRRSDASFPIPAASGVRGLLHRTGVACWQSSNAAAYCMMPDGPERRYRERAPPEALARHRPHR
jgi:hypothetical protein